ncbi:MAG TPA: S16 family serine protease, partial [Pyrinomonadaceae bacterium]
LHDEAEIRGHRRTYVGAMPGRIIQALQQAGTNNPLIMLDEIDKVGADFRGDPSSALLEVLDPEQNNAFRDNYLGVTFDLSNVMFMTTANVLDTIQPALRDRMEVIRLAGYTEEEKREIARRHLMSKQMEENGIGPRDLQISKTALTAIIQQYTQEAGLRQLEREIGTICRKVARRIAEGNRATVRVTLSNLHEFLGAPKILPEETLKKDQIGVATGLAWTAVGGDVLFIEALRMKGKGGLVLTGQLGEVMRESAQAAYSYAKSRAKELEIDEGDFEKYDLHVHIPEGAIPKDGPSAGITMATAMASALMRVPIRKDVAMTGEITLRGRILPIGGVKEKLMAAHRFGITTILLPKDNEKDLTEVPEEVRESMSIHPIETIDEVLALALEVEQSRPAEAGADEPKAPPIWTPAPPSQGMQTMAE